MFKTLFTIKSTEDLKAWTINASNKVDAQWKKDKELILIGMAIACCLKLAYILWIK